MPSLNRLFQPQQPERLYMMFPLLFFHILVGFTHKDIVAWIFKNTMAFRLAPSAVLRNLRLLPSLLRKHRGTSLPLILLAPLRWTAAQVLHSLTQSFAIKKYSRFNKLCYNKCIINWKQKCLRL